MVLQVAKHELPSHILVLQQHTATPWAPGMACDCTRPVVPLHSAGSREHTGFLHAGTHRQPASVLVRQPVSHSALCCPQTSHQRPTHLASTRYGGC
jgi:hypothetical protein